MPNLKILIVNELENNRLLEQTLEQYTYEITSIGLPKSNLSKIINTIMPNVLIVNMVTPTRPILEMLIQLNQDVSIPMIMFAEDSGEETVDAVIETGVSAYIVANNQTKRIKLMIDIAIARFKERQRLQQELEQTKTKLKERKFIEKAKGILINTQGISENKAHHTLRKLAMERGCTMIAMAHNIITMASLLEAKK